MFDNENNPLNVDITLSDSAENYKSFLIVYKDLDEIYNSLYVANPNNKLICLSTVFTTSLTWFGVSTRCMKIEGNEIKTYRYAANNNYSSTGQTNVLGTGNANHIDVIAITQVLGWK